MATKRDSSYKKTPNSNSKIDKVVSSHELINTANSEMSFNIKLSAEHKPYTNSDNNILNYNNNQISFEPLPESNYENSINSANPIKDEITQANQGFKINKMFDEQVEMVIQNVTEFKINDQSPSDIIKNNNPQQNLKVN